MEPGHGDSLAAWVTVSTIIVAFSLGTLFFWFDQAFLVWASAGLALIGLLVGWFLKRAGYGVGGSKSKN
jgi:hydrogenase-4 membrane subunit HyfE